MSGDLIAYFGYGSLVNRNTLRTNYVSTQRVQLKGWKRHWQARSKDCDVSNDIALLSIHRDKDCAIDGMLVIDKAESLPSLDQREVEYERVQLGLSDLVVFDETLEIPQTLFVYVGNGQGTLSKEKQLLQSYLDAVLFGFYNEFGEAGVLRFFETTEGFSRPLIMDREKPIYARADIVPSELLKWFDEHLEKAGAEFISHS